MNTPPSRGPNRRANRYASATSPSSEKEDSFSITGKAIVLVFIAILVAFLFYGFQYLQSREKINASISYVSHQVVDDHTLRIWADVTRNRPDEPAYCIVQAFNYEKAEVGRREIAIAADGKDALRVSLDIPTNERAVAGGVYGCSSLIPEYLDITNPVYQVDKP